MTHRPDFQPIVGRFNMTAGALHATVFLVLFTLALFAANLFFTAHEVNASRVAEASVTQLCQLGNESRAQQVTLWTHLVEISRLPPHESTAARKQREAVTRTFLAYVQKVFAPRDCAALHH